MSKLIYTMILTASVLGLIATDAQAGHRRCGCCGTSNYIPAPAAPVEAAPVEAAPAQAQAPRQGYRAMSYEPAPAPQFTAPMNRASRTGGQDLWRLQKTDPRKYR